MSLENSSLTPSQDATRNAILDASRDLFARFGYKKTTMEDIAMALRKGKSSLYYYFKNKEEIFQAVIETESDMLFTQLQKVVRSDRDPQNKMRDYVIVRMEAISGLENYQKVMKDTLFEGYEYLESIKIKGEELEEEMLLSIINEGITADVFQIKNPKMGAIGIATALKGLELPLFKGSTKPENLNEQLENILNILFYGVIKR